MNVSTDASASTLRHAVTLGAMVAVAIALVLVVSRLSEPRVASAAAALRADQLAHVLPDRLFDPARPGDRLSTPFSVLGDEAPLPIDRRYVDGVAAAAILSVTAPDGYNGDIVMLVGVDIAGRLSGVRVIEHHETPGLGDDIERRRSDWISRFDGLGIDDLPPGGWSVHRPPGRFDAFTGATITPQAVVRAVHHALLWYETHRDALFTLPRTPDAKPEST